ncbi:hypothetical protein DPMN_073914 [Dreissena polymorpha]|uniref:Uncharacterized protein n=1 Tax=Dreissena polymorpha TaxID=45954 RepID=A0A9D3YIN4_DREPO|nr:hypothetical protein DPMN_073914 [Dreissena polymorpha]
MRSLPVALEVCTYLKYVATSSSPKATVLACHRQLVMRFCAQVCDNLAAKVREFVKSPTGVDAVLAEQELGT